VTPDRKSRSSALPTVRPATSVIKFRGPTAIALYSIHGAQNFSNDDGNKFAGGTETKIHSGNTTTGFDPMMTALMPVIVARNCHPIDYLIVLTEVYLHGFRRKNHMNDFISHSGLAFA
jgi:hypothetical protein